MHFFPRILSKHELKAGYFDTNCKLQTAKVMKLVIDKYSIHSKV